MNVLGTQPDVEAILSGAIFHVSSSGGDVLQVRSCTVDPAGAKEADGAGGLQSCLIGGDGTQDWVCNTGADWGTEKIG